MNELSVSASNPKHLCQHVEGEDSLLEALQAIWIPHRHRDLEVRYRIGVLLNQRLGAPTVRQSYGQATIQRVSKELDLDKSDISRMRLFANQFESFEAFQRSEPAATTWHKVRELVTTEKSSDRAADSRALWGGLRSIEAAIKAFSRDCAFVGPKADELRTALQQLYRLAHSRLGFELVEMPKRDQHQEV